MSWLGGVSRSHANELRLPTSSTLSQVQQLQHNTNDQINTLTKKKKKKKKNKPSRH